MKKPDSKSTCPKCSGQNTSVMAAWWTECAKRLRRRKCLECQHRFYTVASGEISIRPTDLDWTHASGHVPKKAQRPRYTGDYYFPCTDYSE